MSQNYEWTLAKDHLTPELLRRGDTDAVHDLVETDLLLMLTTWDNGIGIRGTRAELLAVLDRARAVVEAAPEQQIVDGDLAGGFLDTDTGTGTGTAGEAGKPAHPDPAARENPR